MEFAVGSRPSAGRASDATATATTPAKRRMCAHGPASGFPVVSSEVSRQEGEERRRERLRGGRVNSNIPSRARSLESLPLFTPACSWLTHPRVSSPPIRMTQKPIQSRQPSVGGEPPSIRASREGNSSSHIFDTLDEHGPPTYPAAEQVHLQQRRGLLRRQGQGVRVRDARRRCDRGRRSERRRRVRRCERGSCEADPLEAAVAPRAPGTRSEASGGRERH